MEEMSIFTLQNMFKVLLLLCTLCLKNVSPHTKDATILEVESNMQTYIVELEKPYDQLSMQSTELENWYKSFLPETSSSLNDEQSRPRIIHLYRHVMVGFSAQLSPHHVEEMKNKVGFISASPERVLSLHTTHSPMFLGLKKNVEPLEGFNYGEGTIIGLLDGGISPKHQSFNDEGMPTPPSKWRGSCENGIICNNKLIGAKHMINDSGTPIDDDGHGTHTSSTAAGNIVTNANVFGQGNGTAIGIAPRAHIAMYKVCLSFACFESALMAGMDAAINDGVDVISMSLGGPSIPYWKDTVARGAYAAMEKGIIVIGSAGNSGPQEYTVSNAAPWILTVGASTIDRNWRANVVLGNKEELNGEVIKKPNDFPPQQFPLAFFGFENEKAGECLEGSFGNRTDVKGKIVVCLMGVVTPFTKEKTVRDAGGIGMIVVNDNMRGDTILVDPYDLPVTLVSYAAGQKILAYLKSAMVPTASIVYKGTVLGVKEAPMMAFFSSRGPNAQSPGILKPDITGPGVNILAAWNKVVDSTTKNNDVAFNTLSGTSMSCSHLTGVASLLKSSHPDWSPAAIKSAIMTTAYTLGLDGNPIMDEQRNYANLVALGSGHVNPLKANDPGLVYDLHPDDYISYICGLNYTDEQVERIVQRQVQCSSVEIIPEAQLNYPSFSVKLAPRKQEYSRTVTNVGEATSTYELILENCMEVDIVVSPSKLVFMESNQKLTYNVTFVTTKSYDYANHSDKDSTCLGAAIIWSDGKHRVRSPIYFQDV